MTDLTFTEEDFSVGPVLGPEYRASQRFAEGVMKDFQDEHLQPILKMISDQVNDKLWDSARDWLLADTETNIADPADAQKVIAAKDAEIARLREGLAECRDKMNIAQFDTRDKPLRECLLERIAMVDALLDNTK